MEKTGILSGLKYPFRGLKFIFNHMSLVKYILIPIGINTLLYIFFLWFTLRNLGAWIDRFVPRGDAFYWEIIFYLLAVLFVVGVLVLVACTFVLIGNIILSPFNEILSEKIEFVYAGTGSEEPFSFAAAIKDFSRSIKAELGRIGLFAAGFAVLFLLNLAPGIGQAVYGAAAPLYTLLFLGWEYLDYSMERKHMTFTEKRKTVFRNMPTLLGFGAGTTLFLIIPFISLLAIPVCVAGGALLFCDLREADRLNLEKK